MATVEFKGVRKVYDGKVEVVKKLDLKIEDGEFLVLVGPSGCGKSTLLRMVAGLEEITEGEILIDGQVVNNLPPKKRGVAMVFQSYALYPHMSVYENMAFGLKIAGMTRDEIDTRVREAAKMLQIDHLLDRLPKQLSGGQRQRVAMGRAIVRRPKVFLFDEPLSNLDAALRAQMRIELKTLHQRLHSTIIYVTHDQVEAMTLADRIVVLNSGVVQQVGTPLELYSKPANVFVAGFIGSPQMNFLHVKHSDGFLLADGIKLKAPIKLPSDQEVILGVRPTDLRITEPDEASITARVIVTEPLGDSTLVHAEVGNERIVIQIEAERAANLSTGESLLLAVPSEAVHLFDPATERRL